MLRIEGFRSPGAELGPASTFAALLLFGVAGATPARAIDCGRAKTYPETVLCAYEDTRAADQWMARAYEIARTRLGEPERKLLRDRQREFLHERAASCEQVRPQREQGYCLRRLTLEREEELAGGDLQLEDWEGTLFDIHVRDASADERCLIDLTYPAMRGNSPGVHGFNAAVASSLDWIVRSCPRFEDETDRYTVHLDYEVSRFTETFISISFDEEDDLGGAYPSYGISNLNYLVLQSRALEIKDLLPSEEARAAARGYCWDHLIQPDGNNFEIDQETRAAVEAEEFRKRVEDMRSWTIRQYDARLYFAKGTLLGNAAGHFECVIPFAAIIPHVPAWQNWPIR